MKCTAFVVLALLACAAVATARQDEALDSLMLADLQPVNDPVPRLLAEALGTPGTAGAYGEEEAAMPEPAATPEPAAIPATTVPPTEQAKPATSSSTSATAGVASLIAAAAVAVAML